MFIHENPSWPSFRWDEASISGLQLRAVQQIGYLAGRMSNIGFDTRASATVEAYTNDVVSSSLIESMKLDVDQVRSSVARKLGVALPRYTEPSHFVDGIVEMMLDASRNYAEGLSHERLFDWHSLLFPNARNISVGKYRDGDISVISGNFGRERVHYRAPAADRVEAEMDRFIGWYNSPDNPPSLVKAALSHLWFVSIHPFDDGNGRIARAISDMALADFDRTDFHFYSLSRQILKDKRHYYSVLERTQRGDGDVTVWLDWFMNAIAEAVSDSDSMLSAVLRKAKFWAVHSGQNFSDRQRKVLNTYLDGYEAKITVKNWAKIAEVSPDTAARDIGNLVELTVLRPTPGRVRDVAYSLIFTKDEDNIADVFEDISLSNQSDGTIMTAKLRNGGELSDKISQIDVKRLDDNEITLEQLAAKYFAYALD